MRKTKYYILVMVASFFLAEAKDNFFITNYEYGKMLYKEPRGVSCDSCHGSYGESNLIYKQNKGHDNFELVAPRINNLSLVQFKKGIANSSNSIMPRYDLTQQEIEVLYDYLISFSQT